MLKFNILGGIFHFWIPTSPVDIQIIKMNKNLQMSQLDNLRRRGSRDFSSDGGLIFKKKIWKLENFVDFFYRSDKLIFWALPQPL